MARPLREDVPEACLIDEAASLDAVGELVAEDSPLKGITPDGPDGRLGSEPLMELLSAAVRRPPDVPAAGGPASAVGPATCCGSGVRLGEGMKRRERSTTNSGRVSSTPCPAAAAPMNGLTASP